MSLILESLGKDHRGRQRAVFFSSEILRGLVPAGDMLIIFATGCAAYFFRFREFSVTPEYALAFVASLLSASIAFQLAGAYRLDRFDLPFKQLKSIGVAWIVTFLLTMSIAFAAKAGDSYSRLWAGYWFVSGAAGLLTWRLFLSYWASQARKCGAFAEGLALICPPDLKDFSALISKIQSDPQMRFELRAICFLDNGQTHYPHPPDLKIYSSVNELAEYAGILPIDRVLVVLGSSKNLLNEQFLEPLRAMSVEVDVLVNGFSESVCDRPVLSIAGIPAVKIMRRPLSDLQVTIKRAEDLILGTSIMIALLPLLIMVAVAVRLDSPGPIIFRQVRHGFNHRPFEVLKFRSMFHRPEGEDGVPQAVRGDRRVTRVGRFIRGTSLDELPQIFNVLRGDMSLVGPRPHAVQHNIQYRELIDRYIARHRVKPGITGWAQVNGWRGETDTIEKMKKRIEHDLYYADNWSLFFDLKILVQTVMIVFSRRNAY